MTNKDKLKLAKDVVKYRAKNNLSMAEFAKLAGIGFQTVFNIENNKTNPSRVVEQKIRNVIGE